MPATATACPQCNAPLREMLDGGVTPVLACLCGYWRPLADPDGRVDTTLGVAAAIQHRARQDRTEALREAKLRHDITRALSERGYVVMEVGQKDARGSGTTEGCPDLFVSAPGRNRWVAMELKSATGRPSDKQQALIEQGVSVVVRTEHEALVAVVELALGG